MNIKAVVFDMDGLMLDTEWLTYELTRINAAKMGYEITSDMYKQTVGKRTPDTKIYYKSVFGDSFDYDVLREKNLESYLKYIEKNGVPKKPGIDALLKHLYKNGIKCAVATSTSEKTAVFELEKAGIYKYFSAAVFGDSIKHGKPAPDIFIEAARRLGVNCGECMCLEDSYNGIKAGCAAGMITVMVPDMLPPTEEIKQMVYAVANNLEDVIGIVEKLL